MRAKSTPGATVRPYSFWPVMKVVKLLKADLRVMRAATAPRVSSTMSAVASRQLPFITSVSSLPPAEVNVAVALEPTPRSGCQYLSHLGDTISRAEM